MTTETMQQRADRLVSQEVHLCLSSLVSTLTEGTAQLLQTRDYPINELAYQAAELASPIDDYEEAAIQEGWRYDEGLPGYVLPAKSFRDTTQYEYSREGCDVRTWQDLCSVHSIEPYQREVFEHWAISEWLGRKLEAKGEKVDFEFAGLVVWARCTSGQSIASDSVIEAIVKDVSEA